MTDEDKDKSVTTEEDMQPAEEQAEDSQLQDTDESRHSRSSAGLLATAIAVLALLLAAASGAGLYWLWQQDTKQQAAMQARLTDARNNLADMQAKLDGRINNLLAAQTKAQEAQHNIEKSLAGLHEELGRDRNAWAIAETVYFLQLANARLQLLQDVDTALEALAIADKRLYALGDPAFIPVREKIKKEMTALQAVAKTDLTGTALSLGALVSQIPHLPLHAPAKRAQQQVEQATQTPVTDEATWRQELNKVWSVMRELVEVRRTDTRIEPLLKPEEQQLLVQNIQLQLQTARIAALQRDSRLYQDSLTTAADWIRNAYDLDADITRSTLEQINMLASAELSPALPDISGSLRQLRAMSDGSEKAERPEKAS